MANLAQHHSLEESDEDQDDKIQRESKQMEEDDEFIQQSQMMNDEEEDEGDDREYIQESEDEEDEYLEQEEEDEMNVQIEDGEDDDEAQQQSMAQVEKPRQNLYFVAGDSNMMPDGKEYVRQFPEEFNDESPNKFMHHILEEYALEGKDEAGKPNGVFLMNKKWTMEAAREVVQKSKKLPEDQLEKYMNQYFGKTWKHFDVNESEILDAADMPAFMKYLCSDQSLDLDKL